MDNKQMNNVASRSIFDKISEKLFSLLKKGMFGYFFTSYESANEGYQKKVRRKRKTHSGRVRRAISKTFEKSLFANVIPKFFEFLLRVSLRDYGILLFVMGAAASLLYPLREVILLIDISLELFISGIAICVCAIPLLFSSKSLAWNIYNGKISNAVLFGFLGLNKEKTRQISEKSRHSSANIALIVGFALGVLCYFVKPTQIITLITLLIATYVIMKTPETGVILLILLLPFLSLTELCCAIALISVSYIIKCTLGKRTFKFEYFDVWVTVILGFTLIRGFISRDIVATLKESVICTCLMLSYYLISNLVRSKEIFKRCLLAFIAGGLCVAVIGILQMIIGEISAFIPELSLIFTENQSVVSTFNDPNVLAHFLVSLLPFAFVSILSSQSKRHKFLAFLLTVVFCIALSFTDSLSGVIGAIVAILLLLTIYNRNFIYLTITLGLVIPAIVLTLPREALDIILSIRMFESLNADVYVEKMRDGFAMLLQNPFGIGIGSEIFSSTYNTTATNTGNLLVQSLIEYGVIIFALILLFLVMFARLSFSYCVKAKNKYRRVNCCAGFCSIVGLISAGMFEYTWFDKKIYLLFFILIALTFAYIKIEREDEIPKNSIVDFTRATIDITLTGSNEEESVPKRKYVRAKKIRRRRDSDEAVKEFEEEDDGLIHVIPPEEDVKEYEEAEDQ